MFWNNLVPRTFPFEIGKGKALGTRLVLEFLSPKTGTQTLPWWSEIVRGNKSIVLTSIWSSPFISVFILLITSGKKQ